MRKVILMTGGGGAGTIAAARELKKLKKYKVILTDINSWSAGLRFADVSYIVPRSSDPQFMNIIAKIIRKEHVDIFVPLVDEEILQAYKLKDEFNKLKVLLPSYEFSKLCLDKFRLMKELSRNGISCPSTRLGYNIGDLKFPLIIKPRGGRGSRFVHTISNYAELSAYKELYGIASDNIIIQEKVEGKEYTVSVVVRDNGDVCAVVPKEIILKKGITIAAVTRKNVAIDKVCRNVQNVLKANGPFNVQLIMYKNTPKIFEINPRFSTTIALTIAAGVNEIDMLLDDDPSKCASAQFKENLVMSRYYEQVCFKEGERP